MEKTKSLVSIDILNNNQFNKLNISVKFSSETMCLSSGKPISKGLYLMITPSFEQVDGIFKSTRMTRFTGFKMLIKPLGRFSHKQLDNCLPDSGLLHYGLSDVVMKNNISLKTDTRSHDEHILELTSAHAHKIQAA
jgi:hypothetical protein